MIYFRKPLHILKEGDEGRIIDAIVIFGKQADIMHTEYVGNQAVSFPIQFRYILKIDLWFFYGTWSWLGKKVNL